MLKSNRGATSRKGTVRSTAKPKFMKIALDARLGLERIAGDDRSTGQFKYFAHTPGYSRMAREQFVKILLRNEISYPSSVAAAG